MGAPRSGRASFVALLLLGACGSSTEHSAPQRPPARGAESDAPAHAQPDEAAASDVVWVAGTPRYVAGDGGFAATYRLAPTATGPWRDERSRGLALGEIRLEPGHVHRVRIESDALEDPRRASEAVRVTALLESRPGGPPVEVIPGRGAAGLRLTDGAALSEPMATLGAFELHRGRLPHLRFLLADVGSVRVGDVELREGDTIERIVGQLEGCQVPDRNRGAVVHRCQGISVIGAGPSPDANVSLEVTLSRSVCTAIDSCERCLAEACSWSADACDVGCMEDTSCWGRDGSPRCGEP